MTDLVEFARDEMLDEGILGIVIKWIGGVFKYVFFFKQEEESYR